MSNLKVSILDYGSGNLRSAQKAFQRLGISAEITNDYEDCIKSDGFVLPGVGAFGSCMTGINAVRGNEIVDKRLAGNRKVLGICVGMQVMFEKGLENENLSPGLGQWPGSVEKLVAPIIPHMGWNFLEVNPETQILKGLEDQSFYFVHSYAAKELDMKTHEKFLKPLVHYATHGERFVASVENGPLTATQFHPEKSGDAGLHLLKNWVETL